MDVSLTEAAAMLGKTPRQVRYLIKQGKLVAKKTGKRWVIDSDDLPMTAGQRRAQTRKSETLRDVVEEARGCFAGKTHQVYCVGRVSSDKSAVVGGAAVRPWRGKR